MERELKRGRGFTEGYPYTIGREGKIRIDEPSLSRGHAEIRFIDGKLRLRDLGSTNGTFLLVDEKLVAVNECYVDPCQPIVLGNKKYTVKALLALVGIYVSYSTDFGLVIKSAKPEEETVMVEIDTDELVSRTISQWFARTA